MAPEILSQIVHTIDNPLNGILPNFTIFGAEFTQLWQKLLAGIWGIGIILAVAFLIIGVTRMASASSGGNPNEYKTARNQSLWAGISMGVLASLAVIVGAILTVFG
ncbi:pilin [Cryobacterium algoricola]|uniref:pilin n=1 Tax=Cryobacterium algoricola TaxID=1259183 RepID=UPI001F53F38F|nr:pilin [Cryobacterium algoricola]